jgi:hypothetical protein
MFQLRPRFLETLYLILKNNPTYPTALYKKKEIVESLNAILEFYKAPDPAYEWAEKIILDVPYLA